MYFAEFDIIKGPMIRFVSDSNQELESLIRNNFDEWKEFLNPKEELCRKMLRIFINNDYSLLAHAVTRKNEKYLRRQIVFTICFII